MLRGLSTIVLVWAALGCSSDVVDGGGAETRSPDTRDAGGSGGATVIGRPCGNHVDCDGEAACLGGVCGRECERATDCPDSTWECWGFRCVPASGASDVADAGGTALDAASATPCATIADCPTGEGCIDGYCANECYSPADCPDPATYGCRLYECVPLGGSDVVSPPPDVVTPPDVPVVPDLPIAADLPIVPPDVAIVPDVPVPTLGYGEVCAAASDCISGLCLQVKDHGVARCTKECDGIWDCPAPDYCGGPTADPTEAFRIDMLPINLCITQDAGAPCTLGCTSGLSFGAGVGCVCTAPCQASSSCPGAMVCEDDASGWSLCVPVGQACDPRALPAPACHGLLCYPLSEASGFCTAPCLANHDCPGGWLCHVETIDGQTFRTCHPQG